MSKRKKRTKNKKRAPKKIETKAIEPQENEVSPEEEQKELEEIEKITASDSKEEKAEESQEEAIVKAEEKAEESDEEKAEESDEEKAEESDEEEDKGSERYWRARRYFDEGNYKRAREELLALLDSNPTPEEIELARDLLSRMEMDVRTLMVGAVAMVTLLLIPTIGFLKALWTIPLIFLILLVDPKFFRSPDNTDS